jgi:Bax protein
MSSMLMRVQKTRLLHILLPLFMSLPVAGFAQTKSFVQKFRPLVDSLSLEYGIPTAVIFGVSIIESSSGTSKNCKLLHNYFGIVGKNDLGATGKKSRYRQYPDAESSFIHFCKVVAKKKFYKKLKGNLHYKLWTAAMSEHGYSEVPAVWQQRINDTIRKNKLSTTP